MPGLDASDASVVKSFRYDRDATAPTAFAEAAAAFPDKIALACGDASYTYAALDGLTNQLARRLIAAGVAKGSVVATLTERSAETVIAWLAIAKAGGVYLPYDPAYPRETLRFMVEDAEPVFALADAAFDRDGVGDLGVRIFALEDEIAAAASERDAPLDPIAGPGDPIYIMYTSGSTGRPKGVVIPHRAVVRLVREQNFIEFSPDLTWMLISALGFDLSTEEVFGALLNGGKVGVLAGKHIAFDEVATAIAQYGVNAMTCTSGLFNALIDYDATMFAGLRYLQVGGDVISPEHANKLIAATPDIQFINAYGPTEATTNCTCWLAPKGRMIEGALPIGATINHSTAMVLDDDLKPLPDGEPGMLWVGGDGIALGYLKRPELTAERFRPDPSWPHPDALMYCTGDIAVRRPDGVFEFHGRKDRQVKVDGKRIELDEIEHNLRGLDAVDDAVVVLRKEGVRKTIIAFVKLAGGASDPAAMAAAMDAYRARMPDYMTPHQAIPTPQMPLTPAGKIDRKRLLEEANAAAAPSVLDAKGEIEAKIAAVWADVLGASSFSRGDNFFDVGGTSLLMMRVHAGVQKALGRTLAITLFFEHPRISELGEALAGADAAAAKRSAAKDRGARQRELLRRMRR